MYVDDKGSHVVRTLNTIGKGFGSVYRNHMYV